VIDSHAHLDDERFDGDRDEVVARAREAGIERIVCPGIDLATSRKVVELAHRYDEVLAAVGIQPQHADSWDDAALAEIERLAADGRCVAIGEIGLDYARSKVPRPRQQEVFEAQLGLARRLDLPVIVHCREAFDDCLAIFGGEFGHGQDARATQGEFGHGQDARATRAAVRGVMHCFSGTVPTALRCCDLGLMVSFSGTVTYPGSGELRAAAKTIPAEHLLVETDCPYLPPQPIRGQRNEPARIVHTVEALADVLELSVEDVQRVTTANAQILFGLPVEEGEASIVYPIRDSLYVNLTNRCTNECVFCPRSTNPRVKGHWLRMAEGSEPSADDVIRAIGDPTRYDEIVFCGFGEPTLRLPVMLQVAEWVKSKGGRTRLNTNGQGDLIAKQPIAPLLKGRIDAVSVSLNTADAAQYAEMSRSAFGERTYEGVLDFVRMAMRCGIRVTVTALDYPGVDTGAVERMAKELGVEFRLRTYKQLG